MFERTSTDIAPWNVVAANYKWFARVKVARAIGDALENGLKKS
jgi:polyphosphate kinase 2 (PPK2 family)